MKLKYVIFDHSLPVIFGTYFEHRDVRNLGTPTSAGFCSIHEIDTPENRTDICACQMVEVQVWGESISLGLRSDINDARILETCSIGLDFL